MDTDTPTAGFHRSIVLKNGLAAANVLAGAVRMPGGGRANLPPLEPTLSGTGVAFNSPSLSSPPTAGATTNFTFHLSSSGASTLPAGVMVGVRWDPLDGGALVGDLALGVHDHLDVDGVLDERAEPLLATAKRVVLACEQARRSREPSEQDGEERCRHRPDDHEDVAPGLVDLALDRRQRDHLHLFGEHGRVRRDDRQLHGVGHHVSSR